MLRGQRRWRWGRQQRGRARRLRRSGGSSSTTTGHDHYCHRWIKSGIANGKETQPRYCRHDRQFIVGVRGVFGDSHLGAVELSVICDVAVDWRTRTPEGRKGAARPTPLEISHPIPAYSWDRNDGAAKGWELGPEVRCGAGTAVCGVNVNVNGNREWKEGLFSDESGVNEIQIVCCPFPSTQW